MPVRSPGRMQRADYMLDLGNGILILLKTSYYKCAGCLSEVQEGSRELITRWNWGLAS